MKYRLISLIALAPLTACVGVAPYPYAAPITNPLADIQAVGGVPLRPVAANLKHVRPQQPVMAARTMYAAAPRALMPITPPLQQPLVTDNDVVVRPLSANAPDPLPEPLPLPTAVSVPLASVQTTSTQNTNPSLPYPSLDTKNQIQQLTTENIRLQQQIDHLNKRIAVLEHTKSVPVRNTNPRNNKKSKITPKTHNTELVLKPAPLPQPAPISMPLTDPTIEQLKLARQLYRKNDLKGVLNTLRGADSGGNGSTAARHSMYLLLQTNHRLNYCQSVIQIGQRLAARYAHSPEAPEALYTVGECQRGIQQQDIAKDTWRKLILSYPNSTAARRARANLKNL